MRIAVIVATVAAAFPAASRAAGAAVDWQRRIVRCTGSGAANLRDSSGNPAAARIGAEKAAKLDALRSCMEALRGVQLDSGRTVGAALGSDQALRGRVEGALIRGFQVVGKPRYYSDGGVEVDVEMPLEGALSDALLPAAPGGPPAAGAAAETSLVVDARGQKVVPALAPKILDEGGREIYGPASLAGAGRRAGGTVAYARDLDSAKTALKDRIGAAPLLVKAVRVQGADLVISAADAARLSGRGLGFLAEGKVIVLADGGTP